MMNTLAYYAKVLMTMKYSFITKKAYFATRKIVCNNHLEDTVTKDYSCILKIAHYYMCSHTPLFFLRVFSYACKIFLALDPCLIKRLIAY